MILSLKGDYLLILLVPLLLHNNQYSKQKIVLKKTNELKFSKA